MKQVKKWICFLLTLSLLLPVLPVTPVHAHGAEHEEEIHYVNPAAITNPMYGNGGQRVVDPNPVEGFTTNVSESDYLTDANDAIDVLRTAMKNRSSEVTINFKQATSYNPEDAYNKLYEQFVQGAFNHTGVPTEGDYIYLQFDRISAPGYYQTQDGYDYFSMNFKLAYYTSEAQEETMNDQVPKLLNQLDLGGKSDYEKVKTVYGWLCQNIKYDYTNLNNMDYKLKYSAYAALVNRTAVCQGYAVLFYRLMLELGIDCRAICGTGNGGPHSWNIVELGGKYYNMDATWDAEHYTAFGSYNYFLRSDNNFGDHQRDAQYNSNAFYKEYPMGSSDYNPEAAKVAVTGVQVPEELSVLAGDTVLLTATVSPANATNKSVTFTSSDPEIATVDPNSGLVTGVKEGTVTITATTVDGGFSDSCTVTVSCNHIFNEQIEDPAYLVPETANNCKGMKQYYYLCSICGAVGTTRWVGSQRGDHVIDENTWEAAGEIGHWHPCVNCDEGVGVEPHIPNVDQPTAELDKLCTVCGFLIQPRLDPTHVIAEGLWDFGPVRWKVTADGTLTITGNTHIQGKKEYIWKEYSRLITRIVISDGITTIPHDAFSQMENVTSVYIGNKVTSIAVAAFASLPSLKEITFPASLVSIEEFAFASCPNLETVTFAADGNLTEIGPYAFSKTGVKAIVTPASLKTIDEYAFYNCPNLEIVHLTEGLESIVYYAFSGCTALKHICIPGTVTRIGGHILDDCMALESFEYSCGSIIFSLEDRKQLKSLIYGGEATTVGNFSNCTALTEVTLGDKIEVIGGKAFSGCTALPELVIPDSVMIINGHAFAYTDSLRKLVIPASVTRIDSFAFRESGIQEITFLGDAPAIDSTCFTGTIITAYYPADNATWTADKLQNYGGNITWTPIGGSHEHTYFDTVVPPTCTEDGYTDHTCACGDTYRDSVVPATGHSMLNWYVHTEPTCQSEGEERSNCENCSYYEFRVIPKVDHEYEIYTVNPTCSRDGCIREQCKYCFEVISETPLPATGDHIYTDDSDPTCDYCGAFREIDDTQFFFTETEWAALVLTNMIRAENGLDPLTAFPALQQVARIRADELNQYFDFQRPDGSSIYDLLNAYNITRCKTAQTYSRISSTNYAEDWVDSFYDFTLCEGYTHIGAGNDGNKWFNVMIDCGYGIDCATYTDLEILIPEGLEITPEMSVLEMGLVAVVTCDVHGTCYLPVIDAYCPDYDYHASSFTITLFGMSETLYFEGEECPHDWIYEDCTVSETCSVCGAVREAQEHVFAEWNVVKSATCTTNGEEARKCENCSVQETREIPATGHRGGIATCIRGALCEVCGEPYGEKDPDNHLGGREIINQVDAEEFKDGYSGDVYCADCDKLLEKGTVIPATHVHSYSDAWSTDGKNHWHTCSCGEKSDLAAHEPGSQAACNASAVCSICGTSYGDKNPANHAGGTEIRNRVEATEFADGYSGDVHCKGCGELLEKGTVIPATGSQDLSAYAPVIQDAILSNDSIDSYHDGVGLLADVDGNGTTELMMLYYKVGNDEQHTAVYSIYTMTEDGVKPLVTDAHLFTLASAPQGSVCIVEFEGKPYISVHSQNGYVEGYTYSYTDEWILYSVNGENLTKEYELICQTVENTSTGSIDSNKSYFKVNGTMQPLKEYDNWMDRIEIISRAGEGYENSNTEDAMTLDEILECVKTEHTHSLRKVEAKEATHDEDGNTEYYVCSCGEWYEDAAGKKLIEDHADVVIPKFELGDVDHNHRRNALDALLLLQYKAELLHETVRFCPHCADVDGKLGINSMDALKILQFCAEIIDSFR